MPIYISQSDSRNHFPAVYKAVPVPYQRNNHDCGLYTIYNPSQLMNDTGQLHTYIHEGRATSKPSEQARVSM